MNIKMVPQYCSYGSTGVLAAISMSFPKIDSEMEYCVRAASMLAEEIWQIAEGFVEVL